jgi:hypothetical protein
MGGFSNAIKGDVLGLQMAGFANTVKGSTKGCQMAGFANVTALDVHAAQLSGFANVTGGNLNGGQIAGFTNITKLDVKAIQMAGFANVSGGNAKGLQMSGFANVARGNVKGAQIAGFANNGQGNVEGLQFGVVNTAKKLNGLQFGVVNIADTVEKGAAIGIFNFVKNGYRAIEVSGNETLHGIMSLKMGTQKFYTIFSVGNSMDEDLTWASGFGFGTMVDLNSKIDLAFEAQAFNLNEDGKWFDDTDDLICTAGINAAYHLLDKLSVFGGVSWNVAISEIKNSEGEVVGSSLVPWHSFNKTYHGTNVKQYAGFSVGLRMEI